jgi:hypothetical protein
MTKRDITYQDKLNELRLDIRHPNSKGRAIVLVEGETDIKLFRKFFNLDNCKVENVPGGKLKLEDCVGELLQIHTQTIGIRDADFVHLGTEIYSKPNMFLTDLHDMEMTLIAEDEVFSALLFEFSDIPQEKHDTIRINVLKAFEEISLLKWLNEKEDLRIAFAKTSFMDLMSFRDFKMDFKAYFKRLLSQSEDAKITDIDTIIAKMNGLKALNPDVFQLSNGHDFMKAFAQFLRDNRNVSLKDDTIASIFRVRFDKVFWTKTILYQDTQQWAEENNCSIYL